MKVKKKPGFACTSCGAELPKWAGKCSFCGEWNTVVAVEEAPRKKRSEVKLHGLSSIDEERTGRFQSGLAEFNCVVGGGMVPGSVILIGGDPGIGKSTLALQISHYFRSIYFSGEESPAQIAGRARRLGIEAASVRVSALPSVEDTIGLIESEAPEFAVVDSIQTLYSADVPGYAGSVGQIREAAARLVECAKRTGVPILLVGHITKDGSIAGPKLLEHIVDTVLYFEGDFARDYRVLRSFKNRFGSVNEIGLFQMTEKGLVEVKDRNSLFLNPFGSAAAGNAVSASIEGSRTILFEVQSLVSFTSFSNPRRMADGFDFNRLILIVAVLEKHGLLKLASYDVFINVAGGFRITETASDLAVAMSIVSSLKNKPVPERTGFIGEIALSGEVRSVSQGRRRVQEFARAGFRTLLLPESDRAEAHSAGFQGELVGVRTVSEAIDFLF